MLNIVICDDRIEELATVATYASEYMQSNHCEVVIRQLHREVQVVYVTTELGFALQSYAAKPQLPGP